MEKGTKVRLVGQGPTIYTVESHEEHEGLVFYRLRELRDGLFLTSSLERV